MHQMMGNPNQQCFYPPASMPMFPFDPQVENLPLLKIEPPGYCMEPFPEHNSYTPS